MLGEKQHWKAIADHVLLINFPEASNKPLETGWTLGLILQGHSYHGA